MPTPRAYYNEIDPKAAAWLQELIKGGHIAPGDVDERSIEDVSAADLTGYTQCHFFAGIGGWSYALRLAGWSDDRPAWTGSCPCQPFSAAGKGAGFADERHLWPAWFHLIRECAPPVIFGEQVANALAWFDLVSGDLENEAYAVGGAVIGAHSVGAPHIRQRLYWVADANGGDWGRRPVESGASTEANGERPAELGRRRVPYELGDADPQRQQQHTEFDSKPLTRAISSCWADAGGSSYVDCIDGKRRPVEPGTFPLAYGIPGRVGLLRGYGNAIVAPLAAEFIGAYLDCSRELG